MGINGLAQAIHRGSRTDIYVGWLLVGAAALALVGLFLAVSKRQASGYTRRWWYLLLAMDVACAVLVLGSSYLIWPVRIVVCVLLLAFSGALLVDQRDAIWPRQNGKGPRTASPSEHP